MIVSIYSSRDLRAWEQQALDGLQPSLAPYGLESLAQLGFSLTQRAAPAWLRSRPARRLRELEARARLPLTRTLASRALTHRSDLALALLEPQPYAHSLLARLGARPWSATPLAALTCWLADDVRVATRSQRAWLRQCAQGIDLLVYWSTNQREILAERLGIPDHRLLFVPFGTEPDYFAPRRALAHERQTGPVIGRDDPQAADARSSEPSERDAYVLAAGLDRGRDYRTFMAAVAGLDHAVKVVCPRPLLADLTIPDNVELLGLIDKARYRDLLQRAAVVVVPVKPEVAYPSGQSVLLNAMSCEAPTVVTDTVALADYTRHGENTWTVAGSDPQALADGIAHVLGSPTLAAEIAAGGRRDVLSSFNSAAMWRTIAPRLRALAGARGA
jgi:glycosyltransferase involved in cell wall biosynthesis